MNRYLKITFMAFTIWMLASLINGLICSTYISIINRDPEGFAGEALFVFLISLFFSAPGIFIFWIVLVLKLAGKVYERALFRTAISAGFILSIATAFISLELLKPEFSTGKYLFILFVILSAVASIMMHFNHFKKINNQAQ